VAFQEAQVFLVELGDAFVDGGVHASPEYQELAVLDAVLHRVGKGVEVAVSCRPNVIWVGASMRPSCAAASCAITAFDCRMNAPNGCFGRLRTKAASW
jgi:hypothetical protein